MSLAELALAALLWSASPPDVNKPFVDLAGELASRPHDEACARMTTWLAAHPDDDNVPRGLAWMARLRLMDGRADEARMILERLKPDSTSRWRFDAIALLAGIDVDEGKNAAAVPLYEALRAAPSERLRDQGERGAREATAARNRSALMGLDCVCLLLWLAFLIRRARGRLWPPAAEAIVSLPVILVVTAFAFTRIGGERQALWVLAGVGEIMLLVHGAALRARPPQGAARGVWAVIAVVEALAIFYVAVVSAGLWPLLMQTLSAGAED